MDITLFQGKNSIFLKKISSKKEISEKDDSDGYLIDSDEKETRKIADSFRQKNQKKIIAVLGRDDAYNRRIIETMNINYLVSPERDYKEKKDTLKQRDSGINHVLGKIAKEKNIPIVINISELIKLKKSDKSRIISRIMQNIKICRKTKCQIKIATFASDKTELQNEHDLRAFCFSLGMSSQQVSDAIIQ